MPWRVGSLANPLTRASSTLLLKQGAGLTFPSTAGSEEQLSTLTTPGPALLSAVNGKGQGKGRGCLSFVHVSQRQEVQALLHSHPQGDRASSPVLSRQGSGPARPVLYHVSGRTSSPSVRTSGPFPQPPQPGPALPHCPGGMHSLLSHVLQPVMDKASSPTLTTPACHRG